ncbi:hypothetical protein TG4357_01762 [Thalassovita gelatinovora]|uniref:Uncharacterized protein n=1 Tax=Thalassovita gelatinovora TaxID=53501 RepID=A0A0P1FXA8_THAGE|nr:hypothetical protein [Thalassovita gelatinovora]QIZ80682.1 hypothetical protein HFZ77_09420 [Thalassovita gelatinovora]CUH65256.1 hypothetical protein TG4357_01762 [Thalassovita gelatinovora]SEQ88349.1 hypothetical protein SAMN04488043_11050 [Thalassovita gelatinovora]
MSELTLTKTRLFEGVWEGVLTVDAGKRRVSPQIEVIHLEARLPDVELVEDAEAGQWVLRVPIPAALLSDGVQSFVIRDADSGDVLESFAILAGEVMADDLRAEIALLREELDMLKRAFRRHCLETM